MAHKKQITRCVFGGTILVCLLVNSISIADINLVELAKKTSPAVVLIETFDKNSQPMTQGTGFFINSKGWLATNHHVIEGAYSAIITTMDGEKFPIKGIIAKDTNIDIAVLSVDLKANTVAFLEPVNILPAIGEDIAVVGNPFGLESTVSNGIVSAVREIPTIGRILQISAPISQGSSGSPVLNMKGQVIGVATFIISEGQALNFAIPSETILGLKTEAKPIKLSEYVSEVIDDASGETDPSKSFLYHNSQGHFSFTVPAGWEEISKNTIEMYCKVLREKTLGELSLEYKDDIAFQKINSTYFDYPYIILNTDHSGGWTESKIQKHISSGKLERTLGKEYQEVEDALADFVQNSKIGQQKYDRNRKMLYIKSETEFVDIGKVVNFTAVFFSNYGFVNLFFYSIEENYEDDLPYLTQIIDSFKFDVGYAYGQITKDNYPAKNNSGNGLQNIGYIVFAGGILVTIIIAVIAQRAANRTNPLTDKVIQIEDQSYSCPPSVQKFPEEEGDKSEHHEFKSDSQELPGKIEDSGPIVLGCFHECANCTRTIGKLEHSYMIKGNIVCVKCYHALSSENS